MADGGEAGGVEAFADANGEDDGVDQNSSCYDSVRSTQV